MLEIPGRLLSDFGVALLDGSLGIGHGAEELVQIQPSVLWGKRLSHQVGRRAALHWQERSEREQAPVRQAEGKWIARWRRHTWRDALGHGDGGWEGGHAERLGARVCDGRRERVLAEGRADGISRIGVGARPRTLLAVGAGRALAGAALASAGTCAHAHDFASAAGIASVAP